MTVREGPAVDKEISIMSQSSKGEEVKKKKCQGSNNNKNTNGLKRLVKYFGKFAFVDGDLVRKNDTSNN